MPSMPSNTTKSSTKQEEKMDSNSNNEKLPSKVPSPENTENQAQNPNLDGMDSKDGTLLTDKEEEDKEVKKTY
jgi:hypothetical protein